MIICFCFGSPISLWFLYVFIEILLFLRPVPSAETHKITFCIAVNSVSLSVCRPDEDLFFLFTRKLRDICITGTWNSSSLSIFSPLDSAKILRSNNLISETGFYKTSLHKTPSRSSVTAFGGAINPHIPDAAPDRLSEALINEVRLSLGQTRITFIINNGLKRLKGLQS